MMSFLRVAILLYLLSTPVLSTAGPILTLDKETHDYGRIRYGTVVSQELTLTNSGDATLILHQLRSNCGCTKIFSESNSIAPGAQTKIVVSFNTGDLSSGRKRQSVFIDSNDPNRASIRITVFAEIIRELAVANPTLVRMLPKYTERISFPIRISNSSDTVYRVDGIKSDSDGVYPSLQPTNFSIQPASLVEPSIELRLEPDSQRHFYTGELILQTNHPSEKEIKLRYFIKIDSAS